MGKGQGMGKRGGVGHNTGIPKLINRKVPPLLAPFPKKSTVSLRFDTSLIMSLMRGRV